MENYLAVVGRNLKIAASQADLIVRHLLLPGHDACCFLPIVAWLKEYLPEVKLSVRDGYLPKWQARRYEELAVPLPAAAGEEREARAEAGLNLIY